ncbi:MAG TPA: hydantoinase/oxoprolinase family protein, partial [Gaiellaceae bacterium]|nr:hydantoinase/oxoprolinase family protein [Gaiellaceae bacterium]
MTYRLGVDVGGTFTDLLLVHDESGAMYRVKTPSTPTDPSEGVLVGVRRICEESNVPSGDVAYVQHGTTVATNAMLEAKGARVGLITTRGFKQILHLARSQTPGPLAGWIIMLKPDPPAALEDTREAKERMSAQGEAIEPVDGGQVQEIVRDLVESGVETLTVSLINSYANPSHEREIRDVIHGLYPDFPVTISSDVLPEFREYERTLTACLNSYVRPRVEAYVRNLRSSLTETGVTGALNLLRSDAGLMTTEVASENPIYGILSGPAGGVAGALHVASRAGFENILTFDMGGTSTDVALCQDGQVTIERQTEVPYGWGLPGEVIPIKVPSVNVRSVGAGGGSIAHVP